MLEDTKKNTVTKKKARYFIVWTSPRGLRLASHKSFAYEKHANEHAERELEVINDLWGENSGHSYKVLLDTPNNRKGIYEHRGVKTHNK